MARFSDQEWQAIFNELAANPGRYELPERRDGSVVLSSFNIRNLGNAKDRLPGGDVGRTPGAWDLLARYASRCDFIAIQEVEDNMEGLLRLKNSLHQADKYALVVSDITGGNPYDKGSRERLAFLYRWDRIERTELASDLTYDKSALLERLFDDWDGFKADYETYREKVEKFENGDLAEEPEPRLYRFLNFVRTPHLASFKIKGQDGAEDVPFIAVNAHLLYGNSKLDRREEFNALIRWLNWRTKSDKRMYHENMLLLADLNLEVKDLDQDTGDQDEAIKDLDRQASPGYHVNFPFLSVPEKREEQGLGRYVSTARMEDTYDQIGFFSKTPYFPDYLKNHQAGKDGQDGYDFGVFTFANLFAKAVRDKDRYLDVPDRSEFVERFEWDVSDHHPIWVRLPRPGGH